MDVIITAGGIPRPKHPLYKFTQGKPKALKDIAGKPMIRIYSHDRDALHKLLTQHRKKST